MAGHYFPLLPPLSHYRHTVAPPGGRREASGGPKRHFVLKQNRNVSKQLRNNKLKFCAGNRFLTPKSKHIDFLAQNGKHIDVSPQIRPRILFDDIVHYIAASTSPRLIDKSVFCIYILPSLTLNWGTHLCGFALGFKRR